MRESATCSQCGHGYTYPAGLDAKTGMRCPACGVLIHVTTGLPFGEASSSPSGRRIPATSWLAWGLSLIALILAFIFPSYGNGSTDPLYMLQCLPSMVFGCTAAILFIQGLAALRR